MFVVCSAGVTLNHPLLKQLNELWKLGFQQMVASHKHLFQHFFQLTERIYAITMTGQNLDSDKHIKGTGSESKFNKRSPTLNSELMNPKMRWDGKGSRAAVQSLFNEPWEWSICVMNEKKNTVNRPLKNDSLWQQANKRQSLHFYPDINACA